MPKASQFAPFEPSGVITLTTDFGTRDPFVGVMKGVILSRFDAAKIIDLTHEIPPYSPPVAGFWLARSQSYFPPGSVHLAVVDPGVGTERELVLLQTPCALFVAPDNGLLDAVARLPGASTWRRIELDQLRDVLPASPSTTFHGRDIFAPLVAELASHRLAPEQVGATIFRPVPNALQRAADGELSGCIIAIDHFGNLITDIEARDVIQLMRPQVHYRGQVFEVKKTYGAGQPGEVIAVANSFGVLELAQVQGSAQRYFNAACGEPLTVCEAAA